MKTNVKTELITDHSESSVSMIYVVVCVDTVELELSVLGLCSD